jgi:hypothetical protein
MRRTGWTMTAACVAAVAIGSAPLVGANPGSGRGQDASELAAGPACAERTLRGSYVFSAAGFNIVGGVQQPKAIVEAIVFHGEA